MPRLGHWHRGLLGAGIVCCLGASDPVEDERAARAELEALNARMEAVAAAQRRDEAQRGRLQRRLREAETELASLAGTVADVEERIAELEARRRAIEGESRRLAARRDEQRARIAVELRSAWRRGGESHLKLLLNQEDPAGLARLLTYYRYLTVARQARIAAFRTTLEALAATERAARSNAAALDSERRALETRRRELAAVRGERRQAVADLAANITARGERLQRLQRDAAALEQVLEEIAAAVRDLAVAPDYQPFTAARGAMRWPTEGRLGNRFGRPRNQGKMRWRGVTINAETGTPVNAIHHGRVVYADWLRGSGLLLVLDHGEGYMSLYAHNETLLRDVGDWVTAGAPIATVGASGGRERPALYFEIRHRGDPVDPGDWCRG